MRRWMWVGFVVVVAVVAFVAKTLWDAGEFRRLELRRPGDCRQVEGVLSSEDITVDREAGIALISSADRRGDQPGAVYQFDLNQPGSKPVRMQDDLPYEFHPHGIFLLRLDSGEKRLFVVNHPGDRHTVEIFDYQPPRLIHLRSVESPLMHSPNDVAAVGPESFYVTNDHRAKVGWRRTLEEFLQQARSYLLFFDGSDFTIAAAGLAYANGVNLSPDRTRVYVAASVGRTVSIYRRNPADNLLGLEQVIDVGTGVDNLEVAPEGSLWIGGHPKLLTFVDYMADPTALAPSEVLQIRLFPQHGYEISRVLIDDGALLSASSVATVHEGRLLVGSVADPKFLVCDLR